jgi:hypothetical protein
MFARNDASRLGPSCLNRFKQILVSQVMPILQPQTGFKGLITCAPVGGTDVTAISLWETREHAETYDTRDYPQVMKNLESLLDGRPKAMNRGHRKLDCQQSGRKRGCAMVDSYARKAF